MKTIATATALETNFWSAAIRTAAYFLGNGFTVPQTCPSGDGPVHAGVPIHAH